MFLITSLILKNFLGFRRKAPSFYNYPLSSSRTCRQTYSEIHGQSVGAGKTADGILYAPENRFHGTLGWITDDGRWDTDATARQNDEFSLPLPPPVQF